MDPISPPVVVLAGGFGTRLREVVPELPKVLAPIRGRPFLEYVLDSLRKDGARSIILSLHYKAEEIQAFLNDYREYRLDVNVTIQSIIEPRPLGTGGAIKYAIKNAGLAGPIAIMNGDTFVPGALKELSSVKHGPIAIGLVKVSEVGRYGSITVNKENMVVAFGEKSAKGPGWINSGVYIIESDLMNSVSEDAFSLERDVIPMHVKSRTVSAIKLSVPFIDIGIPEDYRRFENNLEEFLC